MILEDFALLIHKLKPTGIQTSSLPAYVCAHARLLLVYRQNCKLLIYSGTAAAVQRKLLCIPFITHKYHNTARDENRYNLYACTLTIMTFWMCQYLVDPEWKSQTIKMSKWSINCFFLMRASGKLQGYSKILYIAKSLFADIALK